MVTYQGFWAAGNEGTPNNQNAGLLQQDTFANRPAAGKAGVMFFATDTFDLYRDNGTTWDLVGRVVSTGAQTWSGIKTFGSIPVLPASDPTTDNQATRKLYVDDHLEFEASDVLQASADTLNSDDVGTVYTKTKEILISEPGTLRVKFDLRRSANVNTAFGQIRKNGVAFGTERSTTSTSFVTFSEDLLWASGDLCQLYVKADINGAGADVETQNFRLHGTRKAERSLSHTVNLD